jgi:outer membrane protein OmpA-like peptidoglycan-associated protein
VGWTQNTYSLKGKLMDGTSGKPLQGSIHYHDLIKDTIEGTVQSNLKDGTFEIQLLKNEVYGIEGKLNGYWGLYYYIDPKEYQDNNKVVELYVFPIQVGTTIHLSSIQFENNSAVLTPSSTPQLERIVAILLEYPTMKLKINGYTDNTGSDAYDKKLSFNRANAVKTYFINKGFNKERFSVNGYGKSNPIANNTTSSGRNTNRRVEMIIVKVE